MLPWYRRGAVDGRTTLAAVDVLLDHPQPGDDASLPPRLGAALCVAEPDPLHVDAAPAMNRPRHASLATAAFGPLAFGAAAQPAPAAPPAGVEAVVVRATAPFGFDRSVVLPADPAAMLAEVGRMEGVRWQQLVATGPRDDRGDAGDNLHRSERRASAVQAALVAHGLAPALVSGAGRGEAAPVGDNTSADGRAQIRRAEIEFRGVRTASR